MLYIYIQAEGNDISWKYGYAMEFWSQGHQKHYFLFFKFITIKTEQETNNILQLYVTFGKVKNKKKF